MKSRIVFLCGILMLLAIASCGGGHTGGEDETTDTVNLGDDGVAFEDDSAALILASYMHVKDALVESDAVKAADEADKLASMLSNYEGCENTSMLAQEMANNHDLTAQRAAFKVVSRDLIGVFEHAPKASGTIYLQHCPMYDSNKGGDWLSTSSEIRNPYYGDEMLTCGKVVGEIK